MYGQTGVAAGATTTAAGVAALPNTGDNKALLAVSVAIIVIGATAVIAQIAVSVYRRRALKQL
jgi:LPXTG-motif cell wall-anchored protein